MNGINKLMSLFYMSAFWSVESHVIENYARKYNILKPNRTSNACFLYIDAGITWVSVGY